MKNQITTIAFDADDTLWVNEPIFTRTRVQFEEILGHYFEIDDSLEEELYEVERKNLEIFGYGIKGFMLSMIESALQLTDYEIKGRDIEAIISLGKEMLQHPVELLPGIKDILERLQHEYRLMIITKGDLFDQENKIARSGLADYFDWVEILSEKSMATYANVLNKHQIPINHFLMVGNSLRSDILPICQLGGKAIHIPFHDTWIHELNVEAKEVSNCYTEISSVDELLPLLS
jgi:putative hydrolase of the HAD superfamily